MEQALSPLEPPFEADLETTFTRYYPRRDGELLSLFRVFARAPRLLEKLGQAGLLDKASPLPMRQRELVILRTTARDRCAYEWGVHVSAFAAHVGLSDEQVAATWNAAPTAACWSSDEQALLGIVDALCDQGHLDAAGRSSLATRWTDEQQLEILALCGFYHTVAYIANCAGLHAESWAATPPAPPSA